MPVVELRIPGSPSSYDNLAGMSDETTLEQLYNSQRRPLHRFISGKMQQPEEAEDVVQETFVRLVNENGSASRGLEKAESPVAYLFRIASNLAIDRLRQQNSRGDEGRREPLGQDIPAAQEGPRELTASRERLGQLQQVVDRLPLKRRQVFVLHKFRQMTYREVAAHLDISVSMVEKHMMKALTQIENELGGDDNDDE